MHTGEVCLLENIRFHKEEEKNIESFAEKFSYNFDVYINDAFSASHRSHASIVGITKFLPSYAGLMFEKEINALNSILNNVLNTICCITVNIILNMLETS